MTKNTKTYILIAVVLLIWGTVAYKIVSGLSSPEEMAPKITRVADFKPKKRVPKDTFSIVADYRDPFLGTVPKKSSPKRTKKAVVKVPEIPISYTGSVLGKNSSNSIFFVTISGVQQLLKIKQTVNGVTLVSGTEKEIKVRCQGKLRTIYLQQ